MRSPFVGEVVHYHLASGRHVGECRAAIVTRTWSGICVNLRVIHDAEDFPGAGLRGTDDQALGESIAVSVAREELHVIGQTAGAPGTWHTLEHCAQLAALGGESYIDADGDDEGGLRHRAWNGDWSKSRSSSGQSRLNRAVAGARRTDA